MNESEKNLEQSSSVDFKLKDNVGVYSGNRYLEEFKDGKRVLEERDYDNEEFFNLWFNEIRFEDDFKEEIREIVSGWKSLIPSGANPSDVVVHMAGQSHIDMAWKWRYRQTRRKGIKTLAKAVRHADLLEGNFRFIVSQPCLLEWLKEDDPELFNRVKELVKRGVIEVVGGSWVEPDCMMPSGEAFVRQRLYGMMFYRDHFGILPEVEWFLDSFGYNGGLPQILAKSGAKYLWTNKMTWNDETIFPFVHFNWKSPGGDKILTASFKQGKELFMLWNRYLDGRFLIKEGGQKEWNYNHDYSKLSEHIDREKFVPVIGFFEGKGDGGHGPTHQEVVEMTEYVAAGKDVGFNIVWSGAHSFFRDLEKYSADLPVWNDELYLEYHRGCFSVHSEVKRYNRYFENLLTATEKLATITALLDSTYQYPFDMIRSVWKGVLLNQFHDVLPGSSIPEVYDDVYLSWIEFKDKLGSIIRGALQRYITNSHNNIQLFNPLPWDLKTRVFIPITEVDNGSIEVNENGKPLYYGKLIIEGDLGTEEIICQPVAPEFGDKMGNNAAGWWAVINISAFGIVQARFEIDRNFNPSSTALFIQAGESPMLYNGLISLKVSPVNGGITEVKSATINNGENLVIGDKTLHIFGYHDKAKKYPAWNIQKDYWKYPKNYDQSEEITIRVEDEGPVFVTLSIQKTLREHRSGGTVKDPGMDNNESVRNEDDGDACIVVEKIRLFKDDPVVYLSWEADWKQKDTLLKLVVDTNTGAKEAVVDAQYCALKMSTLPETPADKARYEKIMHKYVDVSTPDNRWGVALLNEGKYAFDASAGRIRLTLHRSPKYPSPPAESWVNYEREMNKKLFNHEVPSHSGIGPISARFALFFHNGGALCDERGLPSGAVKREAERFNNPIIVIGTPERRPIAQDGPQTVKIVSNDIEHSIFAPDLNFYLPSNIELSVLKMGEWEDEKAIVLRFSEISGAEKTNARVLIPEIIGRKVGEIIPVDLLERPIQKEFTWNVSDMQLLFEIGPFEIVTFLIKLL